MYCIVPISHISKKRLVLIPAKIIAKMMKNIKDIDFSEDSIQPMTDRHLQIKLTKLS